MGRSSTAALMASTTLLAGVGAFSTQKAVSTLPKTSVFSSTDDNTVEKMVVNGEEEPVYYNILSEKEPEVTVSTERDYLPATKAALDNFSTYKAINGWVPKEGYAIWGLPGAIGGYFDPIGFAREGLPLNDAKRLRESEVMHSRVSMLACVGYWAGEAVQGENHPFHITGPANDQLQQVPAPAFWALTLFIASLELYRAKVGWVEPQFKIGSKTLWTLRDSYYPGDIGFDPLGWKPTDNVEFQKMQTLELIQGRLAMIGWAGMCAQELVNHRTICETLQFYQALFTGGDLSPYYY